MGLRSFKKFFEEITIRGNQGIPGETDGNKDKYLRGVEDKAKRRLELTGRENPMQIGSELMRLLDQSLSFTSGKEKELEKLAEDTIRSEYGTILEETELDIKLVKPGKVADFMEEECEECEAPNFRDLNDPDIRMEVDKAKILNNVIQGEAKNTKHMLHAEIVKDGLDRIYGAERAKEVFRVWDRISKLAEKMDWIIPIDVKANMMEEAPQGLAGAVKVDWKPKEKKDKSADDILKSLEKGEDIGDNQEEIAELLSGTTPVIKARGVDFPMLLHETVKGIYELIAANSIVDDERVANIVKMNVSSFGDEAEDFRYGPEIASDLRDFVNLVIADKGKSDSDVLKYSNLREYVFGRMVDRNYLPASEFLPLFKGILSNTLDAKRKVGEIIDEIIAELKEYDKKSVEHDLEFGSEDDDLVLDGGEEGDVDDEITYQKPNKNERPSKSDLQRRIDDALDKGDMDSVRKYADMIRDLYPE